jgi:hypothetical protein
MGQLLTSIGGEPLPITLDQKRFSNGIPHRSIHRGTVPCTIASTGDETRDDVQKRVVDAGEKGLKQ